MISSSSDQRRECWVLKRFPQLGDGPEIGFIGPVVDMQITVIDPTSDMDTQITHVVNGASMSPECGGTKDLRLFIQSGSRAALVRVVDPESGKHGWVPTFQVTDVFEI